MTTASVYLNVVYTGHAEPNGHYGRSPGQSGHIGGSHAAITRSFENSQKSLFGRTLEARMDMQEWISRVARTGA
jgi:hypothetical protein